MSSPEYEFVSKFLTLATLSDPVLTADYKMPLQNVTKLGVALPALKYKYDPKRLKSSSKNGSKLNESSITLTLKSIRPPKFSVDQKLSGQDTIYQVKEQLVKAGKAQQVEQLKLLLKGKVLHDSELVSDVASDCATIVVMVSKPVPLETGSAAAVPVTEPVSDAERMDVDIPWGEIEDVLKANFKNTREVSLALERLQRGYGLAK